MMKKILVIILGIGLSVLLLEMFLGIWPKTNLKFYDNDIFGSAFVPNQKGIFVANSKEYKTEVAINSHGWPDVEHSYEKQSGIFRILILGDSFVENLQTPLENRFYRQLQDKLGEGFEVVAMGRGDTGTAQQYLILKNYGLKYKPDLVIHIFLEANDVKNNSPLLKNDPYLPYFEIEANGSLRELPHQKRSDRKNERLKTILKNSRIVELLLSVRQNLREKKENLENGYPTDYHVYDEDYSAGYSTAWDITKKLILETKMTTEETGAKYILVPIPGSEQVSESKQNAIYKTYLQMANAKIDFEKPDKILLNFCRENNIGCYSMLSLFKDSSSYYPRDGHWTQEGTDLAAKFLIEILSSQPSLLEKSDN